MERKQPAKSKRYPQRISLEDVEAMSSEDEAGSNGDGGFSKQTPEWDSEALALRQAISDGAFDHLLKSSKEIHGSEGFDTTDEKHGEHFNDPEHEPANVDPGAKALLLTTEDLISRKRQLAWVETFDVIPSTELSFGPTGTREEQLEVHDDLTRELAFYDLAREAVNLTRGQCKSNGVPFTRPHDFFAEMVKTDDHMTKIKDRLIFESKKMDAVAQRKANKEQKLRARESLANRAVEKARKRKEHMASVNAWAKSPAGGGAGVLNEDGATQEKPRRGPNKKRAAADKKYGFGGKRGRFKQNDPTSLNDLSGFNPRGNHMGRKRTKQAPKRKGKRARDSSRA